MEVFFITYQTKNDFVYNEIKKDILHKRYHADERLVVSELAKKYNVSPMPIREALIRLEQEEFLVNIPHVGAKVSRYNEEKLLEIYQIRTELESIATKLLASVITDENIKVLDALLEEGQQLKGRDDTEAFFEWNRKFHFAIANMNPNKTLSEYIKTAWQKLGLISSRIGFYEWRSEESYAEHVLWVNSLKTRNPVEAEHACRQHCQASSEFASAFF